MKIINERNKTLKSCQRQFHLLLLSLHLDTSCIIYIWITTSDFLSLIDFTRFRFLKKIHSLRCSPFTFCTSSLAVCGSLCTVGLVLNFWKLKSYKCTFCTESFHSSSLCHSRLSHSFSFSLSFQLSPLSPSLRQLVCSMNFILQVSVKRKILTWNWNMHLENVCDWCFNCIQFTQLTLGNQVTLVPRVVSCVLWCIFLLW